MQLDVYQSYLDIAVGGNVAARNLIRPLWVIMPFYNEEIHFLVRADSECNFVHEIKDAKLMQASLEAALRLPRQRFIA